MKITSELLKKYSKGNCSKEETRAIELWMEKEGGFNTLYNDHEILDEPPGLKIVENRIWDRIEQTKKGMTVNKAPGPFGLKVLSIAASIVVFLGFLTFIFISGNDIHSSDNGELKTVMLEDGTKVILNVATTIEVPNGFGEDSRNVFLDGEAYFDVRKDSLLPFVIETSASTTTVLGTKFNLSAYRDEPNVLALEEGIVEFGATSKDNPIILKPGELAVLLRDDRPIKKVFEDNEYRAWMERKLVFKDRPFNFVVKNLERFYGVTIEIKKNGLNTRKYNGVHNDQALKQLLEDMAFVMKFDFEINENTIIIH